MLESCLVWRLKSLLVLAADLVGDAALAYTAGFIPPGILMVSLIIPLAWALTSSF